MILFQIEAKSDEKPQFTDVNEDFEEGFNEKMEQKISFVTVFYFKIPLPITTRCTWFVPS